MFVTNKKFSAMKRLIIIVSAVVVTGIAGSVLFYNCSSGSGSSSRQAEKSVDLSTSQAISEWREEERTGVSSETGLMKSWPESGPALIWMNKDLPNGYSSLTFGNGLIYLTGQDGQNDVLVAVDGIGKIKWQTPYGRSWNGASPETRCTPTVEGDKVYLSSGFGDIACVNGISGEIIWSAKASELYKGTYGEWGIAESLLIDGQKLYFSPGGPETMTIALDKTNGNLVWKSRSLNDAPAYVSPVLIDYAGKKMIVNVSLHNIYSVDASDGTILWKINHTEALDSRKSVAVWPDAPLIKCVSPVYHEGNIYVTGGYDHGSIMLSLNPDGTGVSVKWTDTELDVHHGGVVLADGYIYGSNWLSNSDGNWCCLEWNSGKKMYEQSWKCKGSIIAADGMLYIYDEKSGFVGLVKPDPAKFNLVSSFKVGEGTGPYWAHPVVHNGNLFIRHGKVLMVYNIKA